MGNVVGARIELVRVRNKSFGKMYKRFGIRTGAKGTVVGITTTPNDILMFVRWDTGKTLPLIPRDTEKHKKDFYKTIERGA